MSFLCLPFATILLSKESGFNFYSSQVFILLDGNVNFMLYNNVIYRIWNNVFFFTVKAGQV